MSEPLSQRVRDWMSKHGIRTTPSRMAVVRHLEEAGGHPTLPELIEALADTVSKVTVYRTVRLLEEAEFLDRFEVDGIDRYEVAGPHHDHIICIHCGTVVEFHSDAIERRQEAVARALGFEATGHLHLLYGRCTPCRTAMTPPNPSPDAAHQGRKETQ